MQGGWGEQDEDVFTGFNRLAGTHVLGVFHSGFMEPINEHAANMFTAADREV